ncbi:MAG: T9SS type A sorting domain-containing protein [Bacteroidia bacterium]|nr:T9SS type A sorting domain-containing protein [Bacteroidia bacterium]MBP7259928.1 T9SS type A sorting domain-containing protein [Bacteroidia bacterium]MBP9179444.1 T9SS type A sorting domain-containing protein [Bacteroidia bacterium]MBP9723723.1 T9SS type A sorting domain-containing protein [Bacteroidia bacterium]
MFCRDSSGKLTAADPISPYTSKYVVPVAIDNNHVLHCLTTSSVSRSMGNFFRGSYFLQRIRPNGIYSAPALIGSETQGLSNPGAANTYFKSGRLCIDDSGQDYISTDTKAYSVIGGGLRRHNMNLFKFDSAVNLVWSKPFGDTAKVSSPSVFNTYQTVGSNRSRLFVRGTLQNDSFWFDGIRHKATAGQVLLRFDTSGTYLGFCKVANWSADNFSGFDNKGNMLFTFTVNRGSTVQLDTLLSVTVPSVGARHTIVACISSRTGMCLWYSTLYSTFGNTILNSIQIQPGNVFILTGSTDASMVINGTSHLFGKEMFRAEMDSNGAITLLQRNPIVSGGTAYPLTGWKTPGGDLLITDFIYGGNNYRYGCDSANAGSLVMSRWTPALTYPAPQVSASGSVLANLAVTSCDLRWIAGSGSGRMVIMSEGTPVNTHPSNGVAYVARNTFGAGDSLGPNNYVVYCSTDTFVSLKGLKPATRYYVKIIEYNGCGSSIVYESGSDTLSFLTSARYYYTKSTGALNELATWGDRPDGSGNAPLSLSIDSVTYCVVNNMFPYIASDSVVFGSPSCKVILGDSLSLIELTIPDTTNFIVKKLQVTPYAKLRIMGSLTGSGTLTGDSLSEIICVNSKNVLTTLNAHNLQLVSTGGQLVINSSVTVRNKLLLNADARLNSISIGTDSIHPGELVYGSGSIATPGGVKRYIRSAITTSGQGFFPVAYYNSGTGLYYKRFLTINFTTAPTRGGLVTANFAPFMFIGNGLPLTDTTGGDSALITRVNTGYWTLTAGNLNGGRFEIELSDSNARQDSLKDLRVVRYGGSSSMFLAGSYTSNTGTPLYPSVKSSGCNSLTTSPLFNYFFTGIDDTSLYKYLLGKPTIQASNFRVANVHSNKILLRWNRGNGYRCMVIARKTSAVSALPVDSFTYISNASFGNSITNLGSLNYIVYIGDLDSVWVTNLSNNTRYHFAVLEYNGLQGGERYLTSPLTLTTDSTRNYTQYYNKAGMSLSQLSTWGMKTDGSGDTLKSFAMSDVIYNLVNGSTATLTDSLVIAPASNEYYILGSRFNIGNGTQPFLFTIASTARLVMGANIILYPKSNSRLVVNGGFSCRSIQQSSPYTAEVELNTNKMVNTISPVVSKDIWYMPKLKVIGGHYYELPTIDIRDSLELDAMVKGALILNDGTFGRAVLTHVSGGATAFGHRFYNTQTHNYPIILIDSTASGYIYHNRPVTITSSTTPTSPSSTCDDPFIVTCVKDYFYLDLFTGFPLRDTTPTSIVTLNKIYETRTLWIGKYGHDGNSSCNNMLLNLQVTDTILPQLIDTHELGLWTYTYHPSAKPIYATGTRTPYSIAGNKLTAGRAGIKFSWGNPFGSIMFGLVVDSIRAALPVTWLDFQAKSIENKHAQLHWSTASEQNNSHFEIERSVDGFNFTYVSRKEGKGTTNSISEYGFTDIDAFSVAQAEVLYYRLKQVDYNGNYEYSRTIAINHNGQSMGRIELITFPNPFTEQLNLTLNNVSEGNITIEVYDLSGRKHYSNVQFAGQGSLTLDLSGLSILNRGVYIIHVQNGNISLAHKLVKL